jgi:23S rRNA pseudouridine2605 synthase
MKPRPPGHDRRLASHGLARVLSKMGLASRTQATAWVRQGRVSVNGRPVTDPEFPVRRDVDAITIDGRAAAATLRVVVMLNKPRGLVTTTADERGRDTVYRCLEGSGLPWLAPVGRLDKASEGLLLLCNDPAWAAGITAHASGPDKTYHVQIDRVPDAALLEAIRGGARVDGEQLSVRSVAILRLGERHGWLEIVLDEGRNRHIRRLLAAHSTSVLRLVRVAIGRLELGTLAKGAWRVLEEQEIQALAGGGGD